MEECSETDVSEYEIKSLPVNTMVMVEVVPEGEQTAKAWYDTLKVGDVLTVRYVYVRQETITHRIVNKTPKADGYVIELQGDNKNSDAETLTQTIDTTEESSLNYVIGKVVWQNQTLGKTVSLVRKPTGIVCFIILPSMFLFSCEIYALSKRTVERKMRRRMPVREYHGNAGNHGEYYGSAGNHGGYYKNANSRNGYYGNTANRGAHYDTYKRKNNNRK